MISRALKLTQDIQIEEDNDYAFHRSGPHGDYITRLVRNCRKRNSKLMRVYDLKNGVCYLCGLKVPDPRCSEDRLKLNTTTAPSLDHIIPRKQPGGTNAYENLELAHKFCNSFRGVKVVTETVKTETRNAYLIKLELVAEQIP